MGDNRHSMTIPLDGGMVSNAEEALSNAPALQSNARWRRGVLEATIGPNDAFTGTTSVGAGQDTAGVSLIPRAGGVGIASKRGVWSYHDRADTLTRRVSSWSTPGTRPAHNWCPMGVTGGGVIYAGGDTETVENVESCVLVSGSSEYLVSAVTVFDQALSVGIFEGTLRVVLVVQDPATGARLIDDQELARANTGALGAVDGCCALGVMPNGSVWFGEYDNGTTTWSIRYVKVAVSESTPSITVSAPVTQQTMARRDVLVAVTQEVEGTNPNIVYVGATRVSDLRPTVEAWNTSTDATVWTVTGSAAALTTGHPGAGVGMDLCGPLDIAAGDGNVGIASLANAYTMAVESWQIATQNFLGYDAAAIAVDVNTRLRRIGLAARGRGFLRDWLAVATPQDASPGYFSNATATYTDQRRVITADVKPGGILSAITTYHASMACRPFTGWDADADNNEQHTEFVPISKLPRAYDSAENPNGYRYTGVAGQVSRLLDPAIEVCTFGWAAATDTAAERRLHPCARLGVDMAVPGGSPAQELRTARGAKPHSVDGKRFAVAYPADPQGSADMASTARYAVVDLEDPPAYVETSDGLTYVASGGLFTWDGDTMLESTPLPLPRVRVENAGSGAVFTTGDWYFNATYVFQDAAGIIHRSRPYPEPAVYTVSGAGDALTAYVERPLSMRDGYSLRLIGVELYGGLSAGSSDLYQFVDVINGSPRTPDSTANGEFAFALSGTELSADHPAAWWQGREVMPDALPACSDLAVVGDRLWALKAETGRVAYSKPHREGHTYEFSAMQEVVFRSEARAVAVVELAGRPLIFTRDDAWTVYGDGPNANGVGAFSLPQRVLRVGAADRKLVLETPAGVIFKAPSGEWFIVGADYQLQPWGLEIADLLNGTNVYGGNSVPASRICLRREAGEVLVARPDRVVAGQIACWNIATGKWSRLVDRAWTDLAVTGGNVYALDGVGRGDIVVSHSMTTYTASQSVTTQWVKPSGGLEGSASCWEVIYTGRRLAAHDLTIDVWTDYDSTTLRDSFAWTTDQVTAAADGSTYVTLRATLSRPHARSFRFRVSTTAAGGWRPAALTLTVGARPGQQRRNEGRK